MFKKLLAFLAAMSMSLCFAAVDVNKATAADLDSIKGIGPGISKKIIDARKQGNFKDWNDFISRVNGVGEANAAKFSSGGLTVDGQAYAGAPAAKAAEKTTTKKDTAKHESAKSDIAQPDTAKATMPAASAAKDDKKAAKAEANKAKVDSAKAPASSAKK